MAAPDSSQSAMPLAEDALASLGDLMLEKPRIPGDIHLSGVLPQEAVAILKKTTYKAWLFIDDSSAAHHFRFPPDDEASGCAHVAIEWGKPTPSEANANAIVEAIEFLPRPLMIQCRTAGRASAALAYWLAKKRGYNRESLSKLVEDNDLLAFTRCGAPCGPVAAWVMNHLPSHKDSELHGWKASKTGNMVFAQLFDPVTCTFTYLVGCPQSMSCVLIDPVREQLHRDLSVVEELGLHLRYVLNTHCHADHVTSGGLIKQLRSGSATDGDAATAKAVAAEMETVISAASGCKADILLNDGDHLWVSGTKGFGPCLEAIATPGHTSGCFSFLLNYGSGHEAVSMLFTGDTLLIRGCGRTDFQQGNSKQLYESVHTRLFHGKGISRDTLVYPGHEYQGRRVSTIGEEIEFNPRLSKSLEEFEHKMANLNLAYPKQIDVALPLNLMCGVQGD